MQNVEEIVAKLGGEIIKKVTIPAPLRNMELLIGKPRGEGPDLYAILSVGDEKPIYYFWVQPQDLEFRAVLASASRRSGLPADEIARHIQSAISS